jgi:hypothetical protein
MAQGYHGAISGHRGAVAGRLEDEPSRPELEPGSREIGLVEAKVVADLVDDRVADLA